MFGLEYLIGFVSVFVQLGMAIVWAIPMNIIWNRLTPIYLDFLSDKWLNIPYWHIVGITVACYFIGQLINDLTPKLVKIEQKVDGENNK